MEIAVKRLIRDEKGRVMILALILLAVGGLTTTPLMAYMSTGLIAGELYERSAAEVYAADAGVEDAVWKIQNNADGVPQGPCDPPSAYNISDVNGKSVNVTIEWVNNITYSVLSTATGNSSSTTVESYVEKILGGELDIFSGVLASKGDITFIGSGSEVTGDIYYGGTLDPNFTHISGNETEVGPDAFPTEAQDVAFAQMMMDEAEEGGTHYGNMNINSDTDLGPKYITGDLVITKDVTINITEIVYVGGSVTASKDYTLTGSGSIIAEGDIDIRKTSDFGTTGDCMIMSLNGDIGFKKDATIEALIYAPNGTISADKNLTVNGSIVGANITVKKDASLTYVEKAEGFDLPGQLPGTVKILTYNINP